jgi:peroxiredoxin
MKTRILAVVLVSFLSAAAVPAAQPSGKSGGQTSAKKAPAKTPADLAYDEFNKALREPGGRFDQARFQKVIGAGLSYLTQYPTHGSANTAIRELPRWAGSAMKDKAQAPQRIAFLSLLKYEVLNARYKEGLGNDAKAALFALDASTVDAETREVFTRQNLDTLREKIDALAAVPGAGRYLVDRERAYIEILMLGVGQARAEEHLQQLTTHSDKGVVSLARQELNIIELKKAPYELRFTALDGKEFDFAQHRGKVVAMYFWTTGTRDLTKSMEWMRQVQSKYRRKGFEVVTVSLDKPEDRPKLEKYIKDNRISFPVYFDGKGTKTDFAAKLNVTSAPRLAIFDKAGVLQSNNLPMANLEPAVKKLQEPPPKGK